METRESERLDEAERAELLAAVRAEEEARAAAAAAIAAHQRAVGVRDYLQRRVEEGHDLGEDDHIDLDTGAITRRAGRG